MKKKIIVGIDEVGRGPLAGPVSIGIVVCESDLVVSGARDSKVMTEKARERAYEEVLLLRDQEVLKFGVFSVPAYDIDRDGIEQAIRQALCEGLESLALDPAAVELKLDGRLKAPPQFSQESIIRGDSLVHAISLASVVAKVERDRYMVSVVHAQYPEYGFDRHKGYGTEAHITAIKQHGLTPVHRRSFLKNIVVESSHTRN